jgi:hypothetical protein
VRWLGRPLTVCALSVLVASCAGVPPPFAPPRVAVGDSSFGPTLEAYTAAPIRSGNRVEVLLNGEQIFPAQWEAIRSAHVSFTCAQYLFETGPPANALVLAMSERCQAGVLGHILVDGAGSNNMPPEDREALERAGCEVAVFHPLDPAAVWQVNHRNHRRVLVVDGRIGFTGSSGASSKWMGNGRAQGYWRQTDVRLERTLHGVPLHARKGPALGDALIADAMSDYRGAYGPMRRRNLNLPRVGRHPRSHERAVEAAAWECYRIVNGEFDRFFRA